MGAAKSSRAAKLYAIPSLTGTKPRAQLTVGRQHCFGTCRLRRASRLDRRRGGNPPHDVIAEQVAEPPPLGWAELLERSSLRKQPARHRGDELVRAPERHA